MAFQKGQSGNPGGRPKEKPWADALRIAMYRDDRKALADLADVVKGLALSGDMQAIKEIGDRLDGKPVQEQDVNIRRESPREKTDAELAEILAGADRSGEGDANPTLDPAQLN